MNVDAFDEFNAGTIIGYRGDIWETIKQLSGLWKSDGRLCNITEWQKKLPGIETNRRDAFNRKFQDGRRSLWFNFAVKRHLPQRSVRGSSPSLSVSDISSCTPGDKTAIQMIDDFHANIRLYGRSYAPRFPPALLDAIRTLKRAEDCSFEDTECEDSEDQVTRSVLTLTLRLTMISNVALNLNLDSKNLTK